MRRPSFLILMAALWSRFITRPQSHLYILSASVSFFCLPQQLQSCDDGYHLSTLIKYLPLSFSLYSKMVLIHIVVTDLRCEYLSSVFNTPNNMIIDVVYASPCVNVFILHTDNIS